MRAASSIGMLIIGYFIYMVVTPEMWWMIGKGALAGVILLVLWAIVRGKYKQRQMEAVWGETKAGKRSLPKGALPVQPQIMYLPMQYPQQSQPVQRPAGLVELPISQYEWEV